MTDAEYVEQTELTLLRTELAQLRARLSTAVYRRRQAEDLLGRYLNALFPAAYTQALAQQTDRLAFAEQMYRALAQMPGTGAAGPPAAGPPPVTAAPAPPAAPVAPTPPALTDPHHITAVRLLGQTPDQMAVRRRWQAETGQDEAAFKATLAALEQAGWLTVQTVPATDRLTGYYSPRLVWLTDPGRADHQQRFGQAAVTEAQFLHYYKSVESWWLINVTRALILAGNDVPGTPFAAEVWDTAQPLPAPWQRRYDTSEPDLIVRLRPRGGAETTVVVECERALYNAPQLKSKVWKNLADYTAAGFAAVYYVAPNVPAARTLRTALRKLAADRQAQPAAVAAGCAVIWTAVDLADHWLPSPGMVDRWGGQPPAEYPGAAPAQYHFKYKAGGMA